MARIIECTQNNYDKSVVERASSVLVSGGTLIMPTDSVYGIGCLAVAHNKAKDNIYTIKKRPAALTLPWLIADVHDLDKYASHVPAYARRLANKWWPGALTLVVLANDSVAEEFLREDKTLALRVPNSDLVRDIIRSVSCPLATTSANTHGVPAADTSSDLEDIIVSQADLTIKAGPTISHEASTIVRCVGDAPEIIREGAICADDIWEVVNECKKESDSV